jgi:hypothetical protein
VTRSDIDIPGVAERKSLVLTSIPGYLSLTDQGEAREQSRVTIEMKSELRSLRVDLCPVP